MIGIARPLYASEPIGLDLKETVYAFDATTIDLCMSVYPFGRRFAPTKAAIKLHTLLDVRGSIPSSIHIVSDGKTHEVNVLDALVPEPGAFYLLDRGYMDFARLHALNEAGSFFLIRAKRGLRFKRRYSHPVDRINTNVLCDQTITLEVFSSKQGYPHRSAPRGRQGRGRQTHHVPDQRRSPGPGDGRRVCTDCAGRSSCSSNGSSSTCASRPSSARSENAVKTQIWIAVATYVLIAIVKKRAMLPHSLYELLQILSLTMFETTPINQLLTPPQQSPMNDQQLVLL